jgi:hypothetical protein
MTVLVAAASKHGATDEIAERIFGADLAEHGSDADVKKLDEVENLSGYGAFVLGSAIFFGKWMKEAISFVDAHAGELAERPTWLFGSGSITGNPPIADLSGDTLLMAVGHGPASGGDPADHPSALIHGTDRLQHPGLITANCSPASKSHAKGICSDVQSTFTHDRLRGRTATPARGGAASAGPHAAEKEEVTDGPCTGLRFSATIQLNTQSTGEPERSAQARPN